MDIFKDDELIRSFEDEWEAPVPEGWERTHFKKDHTKRMARAIQTHRAGITLVEGNDPIGSGVLVRGYEGHGVLTAGHVVARLKELMAEKQSSGNFLLRCIPQGALEQEHPGVPVSQYLHLLNLIKCVGEYSSSDPIPDYGCMVIPDVDVGSIESWGTFINITKEGPSRQAGGYKLGYNSWMTAGFLEERSPHASVFHQHFLGSPHAVYARSGKRYLYSKAVCEDEDYPKSLGGMSGSGIWEIPVTRKDAENDDAEELGHPILRGIVFWQEKVKDPAELLGFYAHELESIAEEVLKILDTKI